MNDIVQFMNGKNSKDHFKILRKIQPRSRIFSEKIAHELGFSLGKLNYCLKALQQKGFIKNKKF